VEKAQILDAIKRCADANGGAPVGRIRFESETGISESAWLGRYWARWGDAVREAGFEPNELQRSYGEEDLLRPLVQLVRDIGHFPTDPELRMRRRADPSFPSHNAFGRLGKKRELADRLMQYCGDDSDLADVRQACAALTAGATTGSSNLDTVPVEDTIGAVYLMKSGAYYKVGRSNAAGRRAYELAIQLPERLEVVHVIETDDPVGIERYWHHRFADRRANGEWFALSKADVAAFRRRRKFM
jgi:hypothetical protein